jgi:hypothetical protein
MFTIIIIIGGVSLGWVLMWLSNRDIIRNNEIFMAQDEADRERRHKLSKIFSNKELIEKIVSSERYDANAETRNNYLIEKYKDEETLYPILFKKISIGQSEENILDMLGEPDDIKVIQLKTKVKKEYRYGRYNTNRYQLKVFFDNGVVCGWEQ